MQIAGWLGARHPRFCFMSGSREWSTNVVWALRRSARTTKGRASVAVQDDRARRFFLLLLHPRRPLAAIPNCAPRKVGLPLSGLIRACSRPVPEISGETAKRPIA
jgi:hypothetical protein